jgi:hypothetical protein
LQKSFHPFNAYLQDMTQEREIQTTVRTLSSSSSPVARGGGGILPDMLSENADAGGTSTRTAMEKGLLPTPSIGTQIEVI